MKLWYAINGIRYLGPYTTRQAAIDAGKEKFRDLAGKREGTVELLDPLSLQPTYGRIGPIEPRY